MQDINCWINDSTNGLRIYNTYLEVLLGLGWLRLSCSHIISFRFSTSEVSASGQPQYFGLNVSTNPWRLKQRSRVTSALVATVCTFNNYRIQLSLKQNKTQISVRKNFCLEIFCIEASCFIMFWCLCSISGKSGTSEQHRTAKMFPFSATNLPEMLAKSYHITTNFPPTAQRSKSMFTCLHGT